MHNGPVSAEIGVGPLAFTSRIEAAKVKRRQHDALADFKFL